MDWQQAWRGLLRARQTEAGAGSVEVARRVAQGAAYRSSGRVADVRWSTGLVQGRVQGNRATPYLVTVEVPTLSEDAWNTVVEVLAQELRHSAQLLIGQAPEGLDADLRNRGVPLFPGSEELRTSCVCGDAVWPCEHVAGVWEEAGAQLAEDPFLLLRYRGRGRARLLAGVSNARQRQRRGSVRPGPALADLTIEGWTGARGDLDHIALPAPRPPGVPAPALRLLGNPPGWRGALDSWSLLAPAAEAASRWAEEIDQSTRVDSGG